MIDYIWASTQENLSSGVCEQRLRIRAVCLISAFVIRFLGRTIFNLATL